MPRLSRILLPLCWALATLASPIAVSAADKTSDTKVQRVRPDFPALQLPETRARGQRAIDVLGTRLPEVANFYGKSPDEFRRLLLKDKRLKLDRRGRLLVEEEIDHPLPIEPASAATGSVTGTLAPLDQTFALHSKPGAKRTIYLNFRGAQLTNTAWNSSGNTITALPFDIDGVPYSDLGRRTGAHPVHLAARGRGLRALRRRRHDRGAAGRPHHAQRQRRRHLRHRRADHLAQRRLQLQLRRRGLHRRVRRDERLLQAGARVLRRAGQWQREVRRRGDLARGRPQRRPAARRRREHRLLRRPRQRRHRLGAHHGRGLQQAARAVEQGRLRRRQQQPGRLRRDGSQRAAAAGRRPRRHDRHGLAAAARRRRGAGRRWRHRAPGRCRPVLLHGRRRPRDLHRHAGRPVAQRRPAARAAQRQRRRDRQRQPGRPAGRQPERHAAHGRHLLRRRHRRRPGRPADHRLLGLRQHRAVRRHRRRPAARRPGSPRRRSSAPRRHAAPGR